MLWSLRVELYLYSPYGLYGLYRASVPVQGCTLPYLTFTTRGPGSSVGIATDYGLDGPEIESRWGEIFRHLDWPWVPPSLQYDGYRVFLGGTKAAGP